MILEYHRPLTVSAALELLSKNGYKPMGGGVSLSRSDEDVCVVDFQSLGLDTIKVENLHVIIGATARLSALNSSHELPNSLLEAIKIEYSMNLRNAATWGGLLIKAPGNSLILVTLLAMDCIIQWEPGSIDIRLGDWLPMRGIENPGKFISQIKIPVSVEIRYEYIARSPRDKVDVCCVLCKWKTGRKRICIGGPAEAPVLLVDGSGHIDPETISKNAHSHFKNLSDFQKSTIKTMITRLSKEV